MRRIRRPRHDRLGNSIGGVTDRRADGASGSCAVGAPKCCSGGWLSRQRDNTRIDCVRRLSRTYREPLGGELGSSFLRACRRRALSSISSALCTESAPTVAHCGHSKNVMPSRRRVTFTSAPQCGQIRLGFSDMVIRSPRETPQLTPNTASSVTYEMRRPVRIELSAVQLPDQLESGATYSAS